MIKELGCIKTGDQRWFNTLFTRKIMGWIWLLKLLKRKSSNENFLMRARKWDKWFLPEQANLFFLLTARSSWLVSKLLGEDGVSSSSSSSSLLKTPWIPDTSSPEKEFSWLGPGPSSKGVPGMSSMLSGFSRDILVWSGQIFCSLELRFCLHFVFKLTTTYFLNF